MRYGETHCRPTDVVTKLGNVSGTLSTLRIKWKRKDPLMTQVDAMVLGAGIVGTSIGLHLAKRGLAVALIDRRAPGEETSYGNAGVIEGNTLLPPAFPSQLMSLLRIALKRAPEADYHLSFLPRVAPWLLAYRAASRPERLLETARATRPLFSHAVEEHEALLAEAGA